MLTVPCACRNEYRVSILGDSAFHWVTVADKGTGSPDASDRLLLTVNAGSSSLKLAVFDNAGSPARRVLLKVERIGTVEARMAVRDCSGGSGEEKRVDAPDQASAVETALGRLAERLPLERLAGIGHRIVHGGPRFTDAVAIDAGVVSALRSLIPLDPGHLPGELDLVEIMRRRFPAVLQVACFDTAFHRDLPRVARLLGLPRKYEVQGVRRYGFHGLSYTYLIGELQRLAGGTAAPERVVLAHLGSGASLAAVRNGRCVDTTMGFTPAGGIPMGTRSGDVDPGLVSYLARTSGITPEGFDAMANRESGLLGISETSADVRDLLAREKNDARAAEAMDVFCYHVRKTIGAYAAVMGGLDALVFSGGIGENSAPIRERCCEGLGFLGIAIDPVANKAGAPLVSFPAARVSIQVIPTDEETVIARQTSLILSQPRKGKGNGI